MRITKLHILLFFLLSAVGIYGFYFTQVKQREQEERVRLELAREKQMEADLLKRRQAAEEAARQAALSVAASTAAAEPQAPQPVQYTVRAGDTLWRIAKMKEHFGEGHRWYDIWKANEGSIADFDHLKAGLVLTIPLDKPDGYAWPKTSESEKKRLLERPSRRPAAPPQTN